MRSINLSSFLQLFLIELIAFDRYSQWDSQDNSLRIRPAKLYNRNNYETSKEFIDFFKNALRSWSFVFITKIKKHTFNDNKYINFTLELLFYSLVYTIICAFAHSIIIKTNIHNIQNQSIPFSSSIFLHFNSTVELITLTICCFSNFYQASY